MTQQASLSYALFPTPVVAFVTNHSRRFGQDREATFLAATAAGVSAAQEVVNQLNLLNSAVAAATTARNSISYGPYHISGHCTYDCGFMEFDWSWDPNYNSWVNMDYWLSIYSGVQSKYNNAFATAACLPQYIGTNSPQFIGSADIIISIDRAVGSGAITPEQQAQLDASFSFLLSTIKKIEGDCNTAIQRLSAFGTNNSYLTTLVTTKLTDATNQVKSSISTNRDNLLGDAPCGHGDITNSFNGLSTQVENTTQAIMPKFTGVCNSMRSVLSAVQHLDGKLLTIQQTIADVESDINLAQSLPISDVMRLEALYQVKMSWSTLQQQVDADLTT